MSVDTATVRRIAHLARIAVAEDEVEHLRNELNGILAFVEQLQEVAPLMSRSRLRRSSQVRTPAIAFCASPVARATSSGEAFIGSASVICTRWSLTSSGRDWAYCRRSSTSRM